ncbi:MAG TPA: DoxX family protein [Candidatus Saccharimonadales bacterium]|jgi:putative oxidoreductase|nr:DoxX family protein [Candidatus Saccharimonadales bacterium]
MKLIDFIYGWFLKVANLAQAPLLLAIRLYWGWQFWQAGYGKLSNIQQAIENFTNMGVPAPAFNAHFIGLLEATGGVLLILGLGSRLIALPLTINMFTAFMIADREALRSAFSEPDKFYAAAPYTFLFASLLILVFGPGWFSVDTVIAWFRAKGKNEVEEPEGK